MSALRGLPQDPALPQLAYALDEAAMSDAFGDLLRGNGARLEGCRIEHIKYRPSRYCALSYRLCLRDGATGAAFEQRVAARLCRRGDAARRATQAAGTALQFSLAGPALRLLPALNMLTWWWPNDARLAAPRVLADARAVHERVLPELVARLSDGLGTLVNHKLEIARYVPEDRLCAWVDLCWRVDGQIVNRRVFAKAGHEPDGATAHAILRTLQASPAWRAGRLCTPRALLWQPACGLHWQEGLPGRALLELPQAAVARLAAPLGAQLSALHGTPVAAARDLALKALHARLLKVCEVLGEALPGSRSALRRLSRSLSAGVGRLAGQPFATLHGDLHPGNVLVDGEQLALIDFDDLQRGPAVLELGAWLSEGIYRALLEGAAPMRDSAAWQALLDGYVEAGGTRPPPQALAWATAWNLVNQRAWRCVGNLKPGRLAIAPQLIALAEAIADARSLEVA